MLMDTLKIIALAVFVVFIVGYFVVSIINYRKVKKFNLLDYIKLNDTKIIEALKGSARILEAEEGSYSSREEYEKDLISVTIEEIKQNYKNFGLKVIDIPLVIKSDYLVDMVYNILHKNYTDVFSVLDVEKMLENSKLYDSNVISKLSKK